MATPMQNAANAHKRGGCSSIYKGVSWDRRKRHWRAELNLTVTPGCRGKRGRSIRFLLGRFDVEEDAALCYDAVAREWYGDYARLNFPQAELNRLDKLILRNIAEHGVCRLKLPEG